jgi:hypothetical protein
MQSDNLGQLNANLWRDIEAYVFCERNIQENGFLLSTVSPFHVLLYCDSHVPLTIYITCLPPFPFVSIALSSSFAKIPSLFPAPASLFQEFQL